MDEEPDEYERMVLSLQLYRPREEVREAIIAAYTDKEWDWRTSDGCTAVSEMHFPKGYRYPPCVMHDHRRHLARKGRCTFVSGDRLFRLAMFDYRANPIRACVRWFVVRLHGFGEQVRLWMKAAGREMGIEA